MEELDACDIANEYGTPVFVIDENRIRDNYNRFFNAFSKYYSDFQVFYVCKANTNLAVMKILRKKGVVLMLFLQVKFILLKN